MTIWRIEEKHVSPMGEARWLVIGGGYRQRADAEVTLARLTARGPEKRSARPERRIVELKAVPASGEAQT